MLFVRYIIGSEIGAAIVTGIGALASSGINAAMQARTNAQNRRQAEEAFLKEQLAVRQQNEYNSPAQQVLRMKAAGLNPALAYGADGAMVGNQSDVPSYQPIPSESPGIGQLGSSLADAVRTGIEVRDLKIRQDMAVSEMAVNDWQNFLAFTAGQLNTSQTTRTLELLGYEKDEIESRINLNEIDFDKAKEEIENLKAERSEIRSRIGVNEEQVKAIAAQTKLSVTQVYAIMARLPHDIAQMDAQAAFAWAQEAVGREEVKRIARETAHIGYIESADRRDFDFTKNKTVAELTLQKRSQNFGLGQSVIQTIGVITGIGAVRSGQSMPPVSSGAGYPASGTSVSGNQSWDYRYPEYW